MLRFHMLGKMDFDGPLSGTLRTTVLSLVLAVAAAGCDSEPIAPTSSAATSNAATANAVTSMMVEFDIQITFDYTSILDYLSFPDGRVHLHNLPGDLDVTGDVVGGGAMVISFRNDAEGNGRSWGNMVITTSSGDWTGSLTGLFVENVAFVDLNLHGPDQQRLTASCVEWDPASDLLECTGEIVRPHG